MHYLSVMDSSLGAEKNITYTTRKNRLVFFFLVVFFECGLKTYEKYHHSSSTMRTSLSVYPFKI